MLRFTNGNKEIVFCGVEHLSDNSDTGNPMFAAIEKEFFATRPDIAVNEGGAIAEKVYLSKQEALLKDGEIGLLKVLCDSLHIQTADGDPPVGTEFKQLLDRYSTGEFLAYIVTERLMWGLYGEKITDLKEIKNRYDQFINRYIMQQGKVTLTDAERKFDFYISSYEKLVGRSFDIRQLKPTNPFDPDGKFQEIGRASKEIRDQFLLKKIDGLLDTYDKVFIVFGGWHLLTCEPGLKEIINRKRN